MLEKLKSNRRNMEVMGRDLSVTREGGRGHLISFPSFHLYDPTQHVFGYQITGSFRLRLILMNAIMICKKICSFMI